MEPSIKVAPKKKSELQFLQTTPQIPNGGSFQIHQLKLTASLSTLNHLPKFRTLLHWQSWKSSTGVKRIEIPGGLAAPQTAPEATVWLFSHKQSLLTPGVPPSTSSAPTHLSSPARTLQLPSAIKPQKLWWKSLGHLGRALYTSPLELKHNFTFILNFYIFATSMWFFFL